MKFISDLTGEVYDTAEDCIAADEKYTASLKAEEEKKANLEKEKKEDLELINDCIYDMNALVEDMESALKCYNKLKKEFFALSKDYIKKYGTLRLNSSPKEFNIKCVPDLFSGLFELKF